MGGGKQVDRKLKRLAALQRAVLQVVAAAGLVVDDAEGRAVVGPVDAIDVTVEAKLDAVDSDLERFLRALAPLAAREAECELEAAMVEGRFVGNLLLVPAGEVFLDRSPVVLPEHRQAGESVRLVAVALLVGDLPEELQVLGPTLGARWVAVLFALGQEAVEHLVHELAAIHRLEALDAIGLGLVLHAKNLRQEVAVGTGRIVLHAACRQRAIQPTAPLEPGAAQLAEDAVVDGQLALLPASAVGGARALELWAKRLHHLEAERLVVAEQRAVVLGRRERLLERRSGEPATGDAAEEVIGQAVDVLDPDVLAGDGRRCGAEEVRGKLCAPLPHLGAREAELEPLCGGVYGEGELERLGVGAGGAEGKLPAACVVQRAAFVVEQERVLARRRRERALGEAEDRDRLEAQVSKRVEVQYVHATAPELAALLVGRVLRAHVSDCLASGRANLLEADLAGAR